MFDSNQFIDRIDPPSASAGTLYTKYETFPNEARSHRPLPPSLPIPRHGVVPFPVQGCKNPCTDDGVQVLAGKAEKRRHVLAPCYFGDKHQIALADHRHAGNISRKRGFLASLFWRTPSSTPTTAVIESPRRNSGSVFVNR